MRISVYLKQQDHLTEYPPHATSRNVAFAVVAMGLARVIGQNAIQLSSLAEWRDIKNKIRALRNDSGVYSGLLPPLDFYMPWTDLPYWLHRLYQRKRVA